ncbi:MAG: divergent PAP2 family protein [Clostridia bacterium]|nr:divergent PAP2 family protein [Clostridia bacterium]MBQ8861569.1 divergent PAP2 family protein [Clostridia bacterium]
MNWLIDLVTNPYLIAGISSWLWAQVAKAIIYAIVNKKFDIHRLHGDGGMPSGHSATVGGLAMMCALRAGFGSPIFAIAFVLATIVCHDAMNVRYESGKQAEILNDLVEWFNDTMKVGFTEKKLKEFLGHTPLQVLVGVLLGVANALLLHFFVF